MQFHIDWDNILYGATMLGLVGHAVNTFPTPNNKYGQWVLGILKFAVGQRTSAKNALQGNDTVAIAVPKGAGAGMQQAQPNNPNLPGTGTGTGTGTGE